MRCLAAALVWFCLASPVRALDPSRPLAIQAHRAWRSEDGLLQDSVTALLESRDGFLWIGTGAGLARFDGATFEHHSRITLPAFQHNAVQCLAEAADGGIWIGTSEPGLYHFRNGALRLFGPAEGLPSRPIARLLRDRRGVLWAAPAEGPLLRFDGTRFQTVPSDAAQLRIRALLEDVQGRLWVGTAGSGLWRLRDNRLVLAALAAADITALESQGEDDLLVGTRSHGLMSLVDGRLEAPAWAKNLPRMPISALLVDRQGSLWVGLERGGLSRRTKAGKWEAAPSPSGSPWTPLALLEDSSGAIWSGSEERGMQVIYPVPFQTLPILGAGSEEPARMVCQDPEGNIWCLTGASALGLIRQGRVERLRPGLPAGSGPISALWPRRAGGLWVGTERGELYRLEQERFHRMPWPGQPQPDSILALFEDPHGVLWVSTQRQGLARFTPDAAPSLFPGIPGVQAMAGGAGGPLYLASRTRGLGILEADLPIRWLGQAEGLGSNGALSLHLDGDGSLWIGTVDGLRRYRDGVVQSYGDRPGPWLMAIHAMMEDKSHQMWLSTGQGVFQVPRTTLALGLDLPGAVPVIHFDHHDGMPSRETSSGAQPAAWITREGDLYFPTSRGLARLDGNAPPPQGPPLRLRLLRAEGDGTLLPTTGTILVPPGTRRFEIAYTAISLTRADKARFRYRMEGLEPAWNDVGDRRFSAYSNLPPGKYRFVLQAWRLDETGPPQECTIEVHVLPFFYQRPAFWALCVLAAAAFGWWLHRLRLAQLEARSAVLSERNRMAREIHDHLAQGFTGVLLQLEAAEAKLGRMQGDPAPVLTRLDHARNLAVSSLQEARRSVMALRPRKPEGTDLLGSLRLLSDRLLAGTNIQVEFASTGEARRLREGLEEELLRMAQELLTNALRHGKARWVRVTLQFDPRHVNLSIEDDGKGFDPTASAGGYGMRSIRESVKLLRGHLDIDSSEGLGSRISITLPYRRWRP